MIDGYWGRYRWSGKWRSEARCRARGKAGKGRLRSNADKLMATRMTRRSTTCDAVKGS